VSRPLRIALAGIVLALGAAACRDIMPTNSFLRMRPQATASQSTKDARQRYSHAKHAKALGDQAQACGTCHRFDAQIGPSEPGLAGALSMAAQIPGSAACHSCHGGPVAGGTAAAQDLRMAAAPATCITCHSNMLPLLPENHQVAWLRVHASVASADPAECQNCHRDSFCVNCHQNRDDQLTFVHDYNYISFHSVDARANPIQCGNCHREDFCSGCHAKAIQR